MRRLLLFAWLGLAACSDESPPRLKPGTAAPPFAAPMLDGRQRTFPGDFAGRPLAIVFWSASCPPCVRELQEIERLYQRTAKPLQVVAIHVGQDKSTAATLASRLALGFPVLLDEDGAIARRYGLVGLPTTYFVDAVGTLRSKLVGEADAATFQSQAQDLLP
ncbi:MAG: cytochrome biosis protein [Proteobacteria bacterium]|nr:cytochrome biosis protein [Pseudomonadota bacterium]